MIGGGFGGSVLALLPAGSAATVGAALTAAFDAHGWTGPALLSPVPSAGARRLAPA